MSDATVEVKTQTGDDESLLSVSWVGPASEEGYIRMLDQRHLPLRVSDIHCKTVPEVFEAIRNMTIRGAPAIGAAGGYGMALAAFHAKAKTTEDLVAKLKEAKTYLDASRPTAVNLEWATGRILELVELFASTVSVETLAQAVLKEAINLANQDIAINRRIGEYGAALVRKGANILHHCNTGSLATVGHGTALGVIYSAFENDKSIHVWVDETRPRLQGAKLTAFELMQAGVPMHLVVDGAAGHLMYEGKVDVVVFGADRVAANGDVANKIGTMKLAVCAREFGVPVYACVPTPTIDLGVKSGREIVIEERDGKEVTHVGNEQIAPNNCQVYNPAFDVTPYKYLTGIITEEGVCYPPFEVSLKKAKMDAEERLRKEWAETIQSVKEMVNNPTSNKI